ncbi:nucleotidyltransferase family protein [Bacillus sp. FJAT-42376]|uniref:nucleotidyltransferase family protein n=1 Tax=Bacillus sp. FJAT-42376 TaxID=2014076 RepID=UPI000F51276E|nr:nucleotidyltransferase family protein [Bacillus sp. FJAT-42376]AZB41959.1 nucleotidyltransferase family protein [Bacillus sp. FJAT-42376]
MNEKEIIALIEEDVWMMHTLQTVKQLRLSDWWICAGFVRSKVWDVLHGYRKKTALPDVDVIYYDPSCQEEAAEKELERRLFSLSPGIPWSVKNQARMHRKNKMNPYTDSIDAMSKFPETATAIGVTLNHDGRAVLAAPHGIEDLVKMQVKPTPYFVNTGVYRDRVTEKNWGAVWPMVIIEI